MTYSNDPNRVRDRDGLSTGAIAGIAIAILLFIGVVVWAASGNWDTASNNNGSTTTTTGQRSDAPKPSRNPQNNPAPAPKSQ